ncbi:MAG: YiaA/YiaB family inner membrane protein (plasmid) [Leptolyngbya sp. BL-A-14]
MATKYNATPVPAHSSAWLFQAWTMFILSACAMSIGIVYTPANNWVKGYLGMGLLFSVGSTFSLSKTIRDVHESNRLWSRVDEAKLERILAEHDPFKP